MALVQRKKLGNIYVELYEESKSGDRSYSTPESSPNAEELRPIIITMVSVNNRRCRTEGCVKQPSFGVAGTKTVEYCAQHAPNRMVDVKNRKCRIEGCRKGPSYGVTGTKTAEYCAQHAPDGMVDFKSRKCKAEGCGKRP